MCSLFTLPKPITFCLDEIPSLLFLELSLAHWDISETFQLYTAWQFQKPLLFWQMTVERRYEMVPLFSQCYHGKPLACLCSCRRLRSWKVTSLILGVGRFICKTRSVIQEDHIWAYVQLCKHNLFSSSDKKFSNILFCGVSSGIWKFDIQY